MVLLVSRYVVGSTTARCVQPQADVCVCVCVLEGPML
jgi:hypothetical protein